MKKHVLFVVENATAPYDVRVWSEALYAKEIGYEVSVICPVRNRAREKFEVIDGIEVYRHPCPHQADGKAGFFFEYFNALFWEMILSLKIFFKKPFQIIHAANPPDHIFIIALFYKLFGIKYIFDHHDLAPENYLAIFGRKDLLYKALLFMEKMSFKTADLVICTNESYKKVAHDRGNKKRDEVFVVRNGPDLSKYQFLPPNRMLKDGFDYLVAYLGVIGKQEGIDNLLRSVHHIVFQKNIKNIKFIVIGPGTNLREMIDLSSSMNLNDFVQFTGFIPFRDLYEILSTADICVNPEFRNAFTDQSTMIKIMDYMVFNKPIVQYETTEGKVTAGGAARYVRNNDEIEFAEAIIELLNDPEKRAKMGEIAQKRIREKLNWNIQKSNLKKAYLFLDSSQAAASTSSSLTTIEEL